MTASRRVVVVGAAGATGRQVVLAALRAGLLVTATARTPARIDAAALCADAAVPADRLVVGRADVRDVDSMRATVAGHDVVVLAAGVRGRRSGSLYADGARATVAAMRDAGVERVLAVTSAGVRYDDDQLALWYRRLVRPLLGEVYADMQESEEVLRASGLAWTAVRPVLLTDGGAIGTYRVGDGATPWRGRSIARADVARFVVDEIAAERWVRRAPTLAY